MQLTESLRQSGQQASSGRLTVKEKDFIVGIILQIVVPLPTFFLRVRAI
jgi:hypothetical protein